MSLLQERACDSCTLSPASEFGVLAGHNLRPMDAQSKLP